jgi:hypothetical protein
MMGARILLGAMALLVGLGGQAAAGQLPWNHLEPEEQQVLRGFREKWDGLDTARQLQLRRGAQRWSAMSPEQRNEAVGKLERLRKLPAAEREQLKQRYRQFSDLPPQEQERVRKGVQRYRQLPEEKQQELRRQWRSLSPEQREAVQQRRPEHPPIDRYEDGRKSQPGGDRSRR